MDVIQLPHDLFLQTIYYLSPRDAIRCRGVCRPWRDAFTSDNVLRFLLRRNFPECREMRFADAASLLALRSLGHQINPPNFRTELEALIRQPRDWAATFATVARRYHYLSRARPRSVERLGMNFAVYSSQRVLQWKDVPTWDRFLSLNTAQADFHYPDPIWWYSQEDGLLVYPAEVNHGSGDELGTLSTGYVYELFDPETKQHTVVPFDVRGKYLRRLRLSQGVLIFEWAKYDPQPLADTGVEVHHHLATAFDVVRSVPSPRGSSPKWSWTVKLRSWWNLHPIGFNLHGGDRFFSAHNATHYAFYFYRENHGPLGEEGPFEQVAVWDISSPDTSQMLGYPSCPHSYTSPSLLTGSTPHRPRTHPQARSSLDQNSTSGSHKARPAGGDHRSPPSIGPVLIRHMCPQELDHYGISQRGSHQLRNLALDKHNLYFVEEEHRWAVGEHSSEQLPRVHVVKSTGVPIIPFEPPPFEDKGKGTASYDGRPTLSAFGMNVLGPQWFDICGADGDIHLNFCRHVAPPSDAVRGPLRRGPRSGLHFPFSPGVQGTNIGNAGGSSNAGPLNSLPDMTIQNLSSDSGAAWNTVGTSADLENNDSGDNSSGINIDQDNDDDSGGHSNRDDIMALQQTTLPRSWHDPSAVPWPWNEADGSTPPGRWPGYAPCWRHEEFPYLTVSEMVDFGAGIRVSARQCFMLQCLSVHVRPALWVKGSPGQSTAVSDGICSGSIEGDGDGSDAGSASIWRELEVSRSAEAQFPDHLYPELLAGGAIAGDERWVVGQGTDGRVTIVRF